MKVVSISESKFNPASHEDPIDPGVLKSILFTYKDITKGTRLQMINWAKLGVNKTFASHYHEDMDEIFIIIKGKAMIKVDLEQRVLSAGDAVFIPAGLVHLMENISSVDVEYIAIGLSLNKGGKTVLVA